MVVINLAYLSTEESAPPPLHRVGFNAIGMGPQLLDGFGISIKYVILSLRTETGREEEAPPHGMGLNIWYWEKYVIILIKFSAIRDTTREGGKEEEEFN